MAKLHELLAVEGNLKAQAEKARTDLLNTFEKKKHHFQKQVVTFKPNTEGQPDTIETQLDLQTTIPAELDWLKNFVIKAVDAGYQVAIANTSAKGKVVLEDGTTVAEDVPATALLELEKRLKELHDFVSQIPTLDPAKGFREDADQTAVNGGRGVFVARETTKERTKKTKKFMSIAKATDKHPEQVTVWDDDVPVGTIHTQEWSGLITTTRKSELLERVENLTRAVKKARARANDYEVDTDTSRIGKKLLDYVLS